MIFITVGTDTHQFNRLLIKMDELIEKGKIKENVIAQIGNSDYLPKNYQFYRFLSQEDWENYVKKSKMIISHGGAGSIMTALKYRKKIIAVPRLKKYNEHINDHQMDLVKELEKQKKVIGLYNINDLSKIIEEVEKIKSLVFGNEKIFYILENFLKNMNSE